jgi:hypothetical protein
MIDNVTFTIEEYRKFRDFTSKNFPELEYSIDWGKDSVTVEFTDFESLSKVRQKEISGLIYDSFEGDHIPLKYDVTIFNSDIPRLNKEEIKTFQENAEILRLSSKIREDSELTMNLELTDKNEGMFSDISIIQISDNDNSSLFFQGLSELNNFIVTKNDDPEIERFRQEILINITWMPHNASEEILERQLNKFVSRDVDFDLKTGIDGSRDKPIKDIILVVGDGLGLFGNTWLYEDVKQWISDLEESGANVHVVKPQTAINFEMNIGDSSKIGEVPIFPYDLMEVSMSVDAPATVVFVNHGGIQGEGISLSNSNVDNAEYHLTKGAEAKELYFEDNDFLVASLGYNRMQELMQTNTKEFLKALEGSGHPRHFVNLTCQYGLLGAEEICESPAVQVGYIPTEYAHLYNTDNIGGLFAALAKVKPTDFSAEQIGKVDLLKKFVDKLDFYDFSKFSDDRTGGIGMIIDGEQDQNHYLQGYAIRRFQARKAEEPLFTDFEISIIKRDPVVSKLYDEKELDLIIEAANKSESLANLPKEFIRPLVAFSYITLPVSNPALQLDISQDKINRDDIDVKISEGENPTISIRGRKIQNFEIELTDSSFIDGKINIENGNSELLIKISGQEGTGMYKNGETFIKIPNGSNIGDIRDAIDATIASHSNLLSDGKNSIQVISINSDIENAVLDLGEILNIFDDSHGYTEYTPSPDGQVIKK